LEAAEKAAELAAVEAAEKAAIEAAAKVAVERLLAREPALAAAKNVHCGTFGPVVVFLSVGARRQQ
jgi:hypothetical protein